MLLALSLCVLQVSPEAVFQRVTQGYEACLVIQKVGEDRAKVFGPMARARHRFSPCSTFKPPHAVLALHERVTNTEEVFQWDGEPRRVKGWEADFDLEGAIKNSVVAVFEELAERLGEEREREALRALDYGNQDTSGGLKKFWLASSLKVSAIEQVRLYRGLVNETWPFDRPSQRWVKSCLLQSEDGGVRYFGKTGSGIVREGWQLGWWVGWIERPEGTWVFAANYEGADAMGHRLKPKVEEVLRALRLLPA